MALLDGRGQNHLLFHIVRLMPIGLKMGLKGLGTRSVWGWLCACHYPPFCPSRGEGFSVERSAKESGAETKRGLRLKEGADSAGPETHSKGVLDVQIRGKGDRDTKPRSRLKNKNLCKNRDLILMIGTRVEELPEASGKRPSPYLGPWLRRIASRQLAGHLK